MAKPVYLNDSILSMIERAKKHFGKLNYEPTDIGILSAAMKVYVDSLEKAEIPEHQQNKENQEEISA